MKIKLGGKSFRVKIGDVKLEAMMETGNEGGLKHRESSIVVDVGEPPVQPRARAAARCRGVGRRRRTPPPSPGSASAPPAAATRRPPTMPAPPHQVARDAAHRPGVEQQLNLVLALPGSCPTLDTGPGAGGNPARSKLGLEAVNVDGRAAAHPMREREGVGVNFRGRSPTGCGSSGGRMQGGGPTVAKRALTEG